MILWWFLFPSLGVIVVAVGLSRFMMRRGQPTDRIVQANVCVAAGLIVLLSLFLPWLRIGESSVLGLNVGMVFVPFVRSFSMFLPIFGLLTISGGFLYIAGYDLSKKVIIISSDLALFLSLVLTFLLSFDVFRQGSVSFTVDWGPWVCIFGSIMGVIGGMLKRRGVHSSGHSRRICPVCNRNALRPGQDVCDECGRRLISTTT